MRVIPHGTGRYGLENVAETGESEYWALCNVVYTVHPGSVILVHAVPMDSKLLVEPHVVTSTMTVWLKLTTSIGPGMSPFIPMKSSSVAESIIIGMLQLFSVKLLLWTQYRLCGVFSGVLFH